MILPSVLQFFTLPGYTNSGPGHWQSLWEREDPSITRIQQSDWDHPEVEAWSRAIEEAVLSVTKPVVLIAHSCGATAVAHWAKRYDSDIAGAFLVAPPDCDRLDLAPAVRDFGPAPLEELPFPAIVVASENDPYCDLDAARLFADAWGASFVSAGRAGHINTESGHGPWPEGQQLLEAFASEVLVRRGIAPRPH